MEAIHAKLSAKSTLAVAITYALNRCDNSRTTSRKLMIPITRIWV
jgi:hypothetical protein